MQADVARRDHQVRRLPMNEETKTTTAGPDEVVTMSAPRPMEMAAKKGGKKAG